MTDELLDLSSNPFPVVQQDRRCGVAQPVGLLSPPTPSALHVARSRRLNARLENGAPIPDKQTVIPPRPLLQFHRSIL
jgi:hypothetical protein